MNEIIWERVEEEEVRRGEGWGLYRKGRKEGKKGRMRARGRREEGKGEREGQRGGGKGLNNGRNNGGRVEEKKSSRGEG